MRPSILYLDDEAQCLDVFQRMFGEEYEVRTASSPAEARRLLWAAPADIVVSDHHMPDVRGTEFLREVAEKYPPTFRILLTGTVLVGSLFHEIGAGVIHLFMTKPWDESDMRRALERASLRARGGSGG